MFAALVTMTPGRVGKPCECTIREKTGNVLAHLLFYLLHLMFVALWRKPVICRSPYGGIPGLTWATRVRAGLPPDQVCEASPVDITQYRLTLYCWCEYMTQGKRTLTHPARVIRKKTAQLWSPSDQAKPLIFQYQGRGLNMSHTIHGRQINEMRQI